MTIQAPFRMTMNVILSDSEESDIFNSFPDPSLRLTAPFRMTIQAPVQDDRDGFVQDDNSGSRSG